MGDGWRFSLQDGLRGVAGLLTRGRVAECAERGGMTPVGESPSTPDQSSAQAMAQASQAMAQGVPIGTAGQPSAADQYAAAEARKAEMEKALGKRPNPGPYERANDTAKRILNPEVPDGLKLTVNKATSQHFHTSHEFVLGSKAMQTGNQYTFGINYAPTEKMVFLGRLEPTGNLTAQYIHAWSDFFTSRMVGHLSPDSSRSVLQCDLEFKGSDYTGGVKLSQGPFVSVNYFQSITNNFAMGGEGMFHAGQGYTHLFGCAKYFDEKNEVNLTLNTVNTVSASYARKVNERVGLACEFESNLGNRESLMNMGWEFNLRQARVTGAISTEGVISAQVAHQLDPSFTVFFNAILNHSSDDHRFGSLVGGDHSCYALKIRTIVYPLIPAMDGDLSSPGVDLDNLDQVNKKKKERPRFLDFRDFV